MNRGIMQKLRLQKQFVVRGIICAWSDADQWSSWSLHGGRRTDRFIVLLPARCWAPAQALRLAQLQLHATVLGLERLIVAAKPVGSMNRPHSGHPPAGLDIRLSATQWPCRVLARNDGGLTSLGFGATHCACAVVFFCDHVDCGFAWGKRTGKNLALPLTDRVLWLAGRMVCRGPTGVPCRSATVYKLNNPLRLAAMWAIVYEPSRSQGAFPLMLLFVS